MREKFILVVLFFSLHLSASAADTTPPSVPNGLAVTGVTFNHVSLSWTPSTDDTAVFGYHIHRTWTTGSSTATIDASTTTYTDVGLSQGAAFTYTVSAFDLAGNESANSLAVSTSTLAPADSTPPSVPTGLAALVVSPGEVDVSWNPSTDDVAVQSYEVQRTCVTSPCPGNISQNVLTNFFKDTSTTFLYPGITYHYSVQAIDTSNNQSAFTSVIAVTTAAADRPASVVLANPTAVAGSDIGVDLTLTPSPDLGITLLGFDLILPAGVSYASTTVGAAAAAAGKAITDNPAIPRVLIGSQNQNVIGAGVIATVHLHAAAGTPIGTVLAIPIVNMQASDVNAFNVPLAISSGSLTIVTAPPAAAFFPRVFPNPWRSDQAGDKPVTFDQLTGDTTIKIFTVSGRRVKTLSTSSSAGWDLTNDSGDKVASGLYFYLITDNLGHKTTGELVVIK